MYIIIQFDAVLHKIVSVYLNLTIYYYITVTIVCIYVNKYIQMTVQNYNDHVSLLDGPAHVPHQVRHSLETGIVDRNLAAHLLDLLLLLQRANLHVRNEKNSRPFIVAFFTLFSSTAFVKFSTPPSIFAATSLRTPSASSLWYFVFWRRSNSAKYGAWGFGTKVPSALWYERLAMRAI